MRYLTSAEWKRIPDDYRGRNEQGRLTVLTLDPETGATVLEEVGILRSSFAVLVDVRQGSRGIVGRVNSMHATPAAAKRAALRCGDHMRSWVVRLARPARRREILVVPWGRVVEV